jgi:hypothetical protein
MGHGPRTVVLEMPSNCGVGNERFSRNCGVGTESFLRNDMDPLGVSI